MRMMTLGSTGITVPKNAFGALPVQRADKETAVRILRRAYEGGMRLFDTARAYSDSEEKIGLAFGDMWAADPATREGMFITTKTAAKTPEQFWKDLETSLTKLRTDYVDVYQLHCAPQCFAPGDGTGLYECMLEAKRQGKIRHIGITAHKIGVAEDCVRSGLYETMQFPFSYLSGDREIALVNLCKEHNVGYLAMKGLSGGLISNSRAAMAWMNRFDNVLPIWGIQKESELEEWLSYMDNDPEMTPELEDIIGHDRGELQGEFCRGCGYCMPCPAGISIRDCARMSLMVRRAPSQNWLSERWQQEMKKIENCLHCGACKRKCPYELDTPELLRRNYEDYQRIIAGEVDVSYGK